MLDASRNRSVLASTLRGCWLVRDCNTRVLAVSRFDFEGAGCFEIVLRGCWLSRDCNMRVLGVSRFDFEGACCLEVVLRGSWLV